MGPTNPYETPFAAALPSTGNDGDQALLIVEEFRSSRGWIMLFVVLGGLSLVMFVLGGVGTSVAMLFIPGTEDQPFPMWTLGLIYLFLGLAYVLPVLRLYQLYAAINRFESMEPLVGLLEVAKGHARLWRSVGWTFVGMMALYFVVIAVVVVVAGVKAAGS